MSAGLTLVLLESAAPYSGGMTNSSGISNRNSGPSDGSPGRRWRRWLLRGILVVAFAVAALVFWRLPIAGAVLRAGLDWAGISGARVTVTEFTLSRVRLAGIRLGGEVVADSVEIGFDLIRPSGPALTRLSLGRTRLDFTDPAGPLRQRLDEPQPAGGGTTLRRVLDRATALPLIAVEDMVLRYPVAGHVLTLSGSVATKRTDLQEYHARYAIKITGDLGGTARTLSITGTAFAGRVMSIDAGLISSNEAATGSLALRAELSETDVRISGPARIDVAHMGTLASFLPALKGAGGRLSLSVRPLSAVTIALDAPLDRGGLITAMRRAGTDGLSIDASVSGGRHPAGVEAAEATVTAVARNLDIAADGLRLDGTVKLQAGRLRAGGVDLEDTNLQARFRIDRRNDIVILTLPDVVRARAAKATVGPAGIAVSPVALSLSGDRADAFRFNIATGRSNLGLRLDVGASTARTGDGSAERLDLAPVALRLSGTADKTGDAILHLRVPNLSATRLGEAVVIDDLAATVRRVGNSHNGEMRGRVSLRRGGEPLLAPIEIRSNFALRRDTLTFAGQAEMPGAVLVIENGRHDLKIGRGSAELALQPFELEVARNSFRTLLPGFTDFEIRTGSGSGNARLSWGGNGMQGDMAARLDGMNITHRSGMTIRGLSASLRLDRLVPPRSPPGQTVRIDNIAAGVMLDDLSFQFGLIDGPAAGSTSVAIEGLTVKLAGGTLKIPPTVLGSSAAATNRITIHVDGVDLAALLDLLGVDGVSGTGRLSGTIPLRQNSQAVGVDGGLLAAAGPGVMKIRSVAVKKALARGGADVVLMLEALEDFHYETLTLKIDKAFGGEGRILLSTRGHNPAVRNSQPFVINLNVSGNVDRLAAVAAQTLRLPADFVRSMIPKAP